MRVGQAPSPVEEARGEGHCRGWTCGATVQRPHHLQRRGPNRVDHLGSRKGGQALLWDGREASFRAGEVAGQALLQDRVEGSFNHSNPR